MSYQGDVLTINYQLSAISSPARSLLYQTEQGCKLLRLNRVSLI